MERLAEIRNNGQFVEVIVVWECDFRAQLAADPDLQRMYDEYEIPEPLHPRKHALRGGRVEPFCLHHECAEDEEIVTVDIVSCILISLILFLIVAFLGCIPCYPQRDLKLIGGKTAEELYRATMARLEEIRNRGQFVEVIEVWECEFRAELAADPELREKYESYEIPEPLHPRNHALRGGRVEPFCLHHECAEDEEIVTVDIVSCVIFNKFYQSF